MTGCTIARELLLKPIVIYACIAALAACGSHSTGTSAFLPTSPAIIRAETDAASKPHFTLYRIPKTVDGYHYSSPAQVVVDANDNAWFSCWAVCGGMIGKVTPGGKFGVYVPFYQGSIFAKMLKKYGDEPGSITIGPDGALWFLDESVYPQKSALAISVVGRMDIADPFNGAASFQGWQVPIQGNLGTLASNGKRVWFSAGCTDIGSDCHDVYAMTPKGAIRHERWALGSNYQASPISMTQGPDGSIWMSWNDNKAPYGSYMEHWKASGAVHRYALPSTKTEAYTLTADVNGAVWYQDTDFCGTPPDPKASNKIGRIDATGRIKEFCMPPGYGVFGGMAYAKGYIWFVGGSHHHFYLFRVNLNGRMAKFALPSIISNPLGLATGTRNDLWMTDAGSNSVMRITL